MKTNWKEETLGQISKLSNKGIEWKDMPYWLRFRLKLMNLLNDWFSLEEIKEGWPMIRMQFKSWKFYRKYKYLKKN